MNRDIVVLREVIQKLVPMLADKGLVVTQRGSQAYVKTNTVTRKPELVNIPNIPDNATVEFIEAIQGFIDHEIGHVLHTNWDYYGRAPSSEDLKKTSVQQFLNTHNIVEDVMIEREMAKTFPGSKRNISRTRLYFLSKITEPALAKAANEKEAFIYLVVPAMRALGDHVEMKEWMDKNGHWSNKYVDGIVKGLKPETIELLKTCSTTKETLAIAEELHLILYPPAPPAPPEPEPEEEEEGTATPPPPPAPPKPSAEKSKPSEVKKDDEDEEKGSSEDKPEKEADEGDGTGERDHDALDPDEEADDEGEPSDESGDVSENASDDGAGDDPSDDEATEDGTPDDTSDGDDEADDGDDEADEKDESLTSGASTGGDKPDFDEPEDETEDGEGSAGSSAFRTEGDEGGGVGGLEDPDEEATPGNGGGVGNRAGKSIFEFEEDAFDKADMSSQIGILISEEAVLAMDPKQYLVFTREMDVIQPIDVPENINESWVPEMEEKTRLLTAKMRKDIERMLASQSHVIRTPGHRKGKLHSPSLYRVSQGDPRVFAVKEEHVSKDTAVCLLVDNSGSMYGEKMALATTASYALSTTLEAVKIAHEVLGFTSGSYYNVPPLMRQAMEEDIASSGIEYDRLEPIMIPIYKAFDERINATVKRRFAYMLNAQKGLAGNIDGESLEYAAERLMRRSEKRKVMIVLSDGQPAGSDKSGPHLSFVTRQLEKSGIECIGIGIMDGSVKKYYPKWTVINNAQELPNQVMREIKAILS